MKRHEFEHAVRAAGAILDTDAVLVIGSQAIHGSLVDVFPEAARSIEVDIGSLGGDADRSADLIDGSIGELSMFQSSFGYYAQGVTSDTAILPDGWRDRLVPYTSEGTNGVTAWCLELHDLWISKAVANRPKDLEFCRALAKVEGIDSDVLKTRLLQVKHIESEVMTLANALIDSV